MAYVFSWYAPRVLKLASVHAAYACLAIFARRAAFAAGVETPLCASVLLFDANSAINALFSMKRRSAVRNCIGADYFSGYSRLAGVL